MNNLKNNLKNSLKAKIYWIVILVLSLTNTSFAEESKELKEHLSTAFTAGAATGGAYLLLTKPRSTKNLEKASPGIAKKLEGAAAAYQAEVDRQMPLFLEARARQKSLLEEWYQVKESGRNPEEAQRLRRLLNEGDGARLYTAINDELTIAEKNARLAKESAWAFNKSFGTSAPDWERKHARELFVTMNFKPLSETPAFSETQSLLKQSQRSVQQKRWLGGISLLLAFINGTGFSSKIGNSLPEMEKISGSFAKKPSAPIFVESGSGNIVDVQVQAK